MLSTLIFYQKVMLKLWPNPPNDHHLNDLIHAALFQLYQCHNLDSTWDSRGSLNQCRIDTQQNLRKEIIFFSPKQRALYSSHNHTPLYESAELTRRFLFYFLSFGCPQACIGRSGSPTLSELCFALSPQLSLVCKFKHTSSPSVDCVLQKT